MAKIDIVVPAYNRGRWIDECFESLASQDFQDWRIIARDDASADDTAARLAIWKAKLGDRMTLAAGSGQRNLGLIPNYDAVAAESDAPYVMFVDPDDVWLPGKIKRSLLALQEAEGECGAGTPVIVGSDCTVVDDDTKVIAPSFWEWTRMKPALASQFRRVIVECPILTSTMMVNRALLDLALPFRGAASPDWWCTMVASAFGRVVLLEWNTTLYRRHSTNDSIEPFAQRLPRAIKRTLAEPAAPRRRVTGLLNQLAPQAKAFADRFSEHLSPKDLRAVEAAGRITRIGGMARRKAVIEHGLWFGSPLKNLGFLLLL